MKTEEYVELYCDLAELLYKERHHGYQLSKQYDTSDYYYPPWEEEDGSRTEFGEAKMIRCIDDIEEVLSQFNLKED